MENLSLTVGGTTNSYSVVYDIWTKDQINNNGSQNTVYFARGADWNMSTTSILILYTVSSSSVAKLGIITDSDCYFEEKWYEKGIHFLGNSNNLYISNFEFDYTTLEFNEYYKNIFKNEKASNVYKLDLTEFLSKDVDTALIPLLNAEISKYKAGDILLVPEALL
jgi:hypothetical protein